jgi:hypothetical protein
MTSQLLNDIGGLSNAGGIVTGPLTAQAGLTVTGGFSVDTLVAANPVLGAATPSVTTGATGHTFTTSTFYLCGVLFRTGLTGVANDNPPSPAVLTAAVPNCQVGTTVNLRIVNSSAFALTLGNVTNITYSGTGGGNVIAANSWRDFVIVVTSVTTPAITFYSSGSGTL